MKEKLQPILIAINICQVKERIIDFLSQKNEGKIDFKQKRISMGRKDPIEAKYLNQ